MSAFSLSSRHPREDGDPFLVWIPSFEGMTFQSTTINKPRSLENSGFCFLSIVNIKSNRFGYLGG